MSYSLHAYYLSISIEFRNIPKLRICTKINVCPVHLTANLHIEFEVCYLMPFLRYPVYKNLSTGGSLFKNMFFLKPCVITYFWHCFWFRKVNFFALVRENKFLLSIDIRMHYSLIPSVEYFKLCKQ